MNTIMNAIFNQHRIARIMAVLMICLTCFAGNAWGATKSGSWNFGTSGNANWTAVANGTGYCGGWGCKGSTT